MTLPMHGATNAATNAAANAPVGAARATHATEAGTEPPADAVDLTDPLARSAVDQAVALAVPGLGTVVLGAVLKRPSRARGGEAVVRRGVLTVSSGTVPPQEQQVIVKSRPATPFGDEGFRREAEVLAELDGLGPSPTDPLVGRVPRLLRAWRDDRGSHVLIETLPGASIVELLGGLAGRDLDVEQVADIVERLGASVAALHGRGISHNDLSWGNVLVDLGEAGDVRAVALVDFGLATRLGDAAPRAATPGFIATRQWREGLAVPENDTSSLARVAYSLLTRINPSRSDLEPVARIRRDVGERASQLLQRGINDTASFSGPRGPARRFTTELTAALRGVGSSELLAELRRAWQLQLTMSTDVTRLGELESGLRHDLAPGERFAGLLEAARMWAAASASPQVAGAGPEELRAKAASALADAVLALGDGPSVPDHRETRAFRSSDADLFRSLHALTADFLAHRGLPPAEVERRIRVLWLTWADGFEPHLRQVREFRPAWVPAVRSELPPPPPPVTAGGAPSPVPVHPAPPSPPPGYPPPAYPPPAYPVTPPDTWPEPPAPDHGYVPPRPAARAVRTFASGMTVALGVALLLATTAIGLWSYAPDIPSWHLGVVPIGALLTVVLLRTRLRRWRVRRRLVGRHPDAARRSRGARVATALLLAAGGVLLLVAPLPDAAATVGDLAALTVLAGSVLSLGAPTRGDTAALLTNLVAVAVLLWATVAVGFQTWLVHAAIPGFVDTAYSTMPAFAWPERAGGTVALGGGLSQQVGVGGTEDRGVRAGLQDLSGAVPPSRFSAEGIGVRDGLIVVAHTLTAVDATPLEPTERLVLLVPTDEVVGGGWYDGDGVGLVRLGDAVVGVWAPDLWSAADGGDEPAPGELVRGSAAWTPLEGSPRHLLALALLDEELAEVTAVAPLTAWP
jgi:serine/threonine protein kinase